MRFSHLLITIVASVSMASSPSGSPSSLEVRQSVERGLSFLERDGLAWMKKQQCASCHHIPLMIWGLGEGRKHGYPVNVEAINHATSWVLADGNLAKVFPDLPLDKERSEPDYLGPLNMALAIVGSGIGDSWAEKVQRTLLDRVVTQQMADGSWNANKGGRPPVHGSIDVQTSWFYLALATSTPKNGEGDPCKIQRDKASQWLTRMGVDTTSHQSLTMRLMVLSKLGGASDQKKQLVAALLREQDAAGGWSQRPNMKSDAFATGQALYVLMGSRDTGVAEAVRRATRFLVDTQQLDGSWQMTSRSAEPPGPGPARDLKPIIYVGTAWATMGLAGWWPVPEAG
jgi:Prenyltransferase and squalene oxidase repeat